jgi:aminoglycoside phosphotransferase family enzyme/predicted kinase
VRRGGRLVLGGSGEGEAVDWAVAMQRLPSAAMLDALLARGSIDNEMLRQLAATLAEFHAASATGEGVDQFGTVAAVRGKIEDNFAETDRFVRSRTVEALPADVHDLVEAWALHFLRERAEALAERERSGRIREGHGDLHAGNICFRAPQDGGLVIYDRIEFSAAFRCGDVAEDLAFLLMDLDHRGYRGFSEFLAREYIARTGDHGILDVVDLYKCYRAWVRGKVTALRAAQCEGAVREATRLDALAYFNLGAGYAIPASLVLLCGLPGSGKSFAAAQVAAALDCKLLNSDEWRKALAGVPSLRHRPVEFGTGLYGAEQTKRTYDHLLQVAAETLDGGRSVVVDAGFRQRAQRGPFLDLARARRLPAVVLHLDPPQAVVEARLEQRSARGEGASDADVAVYRACLAGFEPPEPDEGAPVVRETTPRPPPEVAAAVLARLLAAAEVSADPGEA